jgi:hypothetical protein
METTNRIQRLLFRTIDALDRKELADAEAVRKLLIRTASKRTPFLYESLSRHIDMLIAEYC